MTGDKFRGGARTAHEIERVSRRIAVLESRLSALRTELQIASGNGRLKIALERETGLERVGPYVRRPIAARYQTPPESGNRRASSRT